MRCNSQSSTHRKRPVHYRYLMLGFVALVVQASCSDGSAVTPETSRPDASTSDRSASQSEHALQLLLVDDVGFQSYSAAFEREFAATASCAAAAGFEYSHRSGDRSALALPMRGANLAVRAEIGYGLRPDGGDAHDAYVRALPPAENRRYAETMFGTVPDESIDLPDGSEFQYPVEGCIADSRASVYGAVETWADMFLYPQGHRALASIDVADQPSYASGLASWKECMASKRYTFGSPAAAQEAAAELYRDDLPDESAVQEERRLAVADGECAASSGLLVNLEQVFADYLRALDPVELERLADSWRKLEESAE